MGDQELQTPPSDQPSPNSQTSSPAATVPGSPAVTTPPLNTDPLNSTTFMPVFQNIIPNMEEFLHKGSAGRIGVIGGSRFYTGAPFYSAFTTLRLGGDLSYVITSKSPAAVIKNYSPELIVCPVLDSHDAMLEIGQLLPKIHSLIIGPGLGKEGDVYKTVIRTVEMAKEQKIPLIFDADAMFLLTRFPELVRGYKRCVITPNAKEFDYLASKLGLPALNQNSGENGVREAVRAMAAKLEGVVVVRKGQIDVISDGSLVAICNIPGSPRRCGGQGDVLAGACGLYTHWSTLALARQKPLIPTVTPFFFAAYAACVVTRTASIITFRQLNRSMLTTDILNNLGSVYKALNFN
jgi:ATP-dependent NAD(P)H-hydrate dehydratase